MVALKEKMSKKKHEYFAMRRNLFDSLEGMARESEEIIRKIYEAVGETHILIGKRGLWEKYVDLGYEKSFLTGKRYSIQIDDNHRIYVVPEKGTEKKEKVTKRTGLGKILLGPEKRETVEVIVPTRHVSVRYEPHSNAGQFAEGTFWDYPGKNEEPTLVNIARSIKERGNVKDAEKFAELNKRIRELPKKIVKHLEQRSKELEAARTLGSVEDVDKLDYIKPECGYCGAPNPDLHPTCGHCGHKAYEIPKKVRHK